MSKNKFYFSHDGGARNDDKIIAVRMKHKAEGYAVYFMILEKLLESSNYMSVKDYNVLAFDFRVSSNVVKSIIEDFGLFEFSEDGKFFYSTKFNDRMKPLDKLRELRSEAGKKSAEKRANQQKVNTCSTSVEQNSNKSEILLTENSTKDKRIDNNTTNVDIINIYSENSNFENSENSDLKNSKKEKEKSCAKKEKGFSKEDFKHKLLELGAELNHVEDWIKVRVSKKATFTQTALNAFLNECNKNNFPIAEAVKLCAERSWQGFKYQWILNENQRNGTAITNTNFASSESKQPYFFDRERAMQALTGQTAGGLSEN